MQLKSIYRKTCLLKAIFRYLWNPKQVSSVLKLGNAVSVLSDNEKTIRNLKKDKETKDLINSKYGLTKFDFTYMAGLAQGTLGYEFNNYIKTNQLNPEFYDQFTPAVELSDYAYLVYRMRKTHDIWHLITGFDNSEQGEAGLIAFYYSQLSTPLSGLIIGLSFVHFLLRRPKDLPLLLNEISRGWRSGLAAKALIAIKWEELFDEPIENLRVQLNII